MRRTILFLSLLTVVLAGRAQTLGERLWSTAATTRKAACFAFAAKTNLVAVVSDDGWTQIISVDDQIVVRAFPGPPAFKCNLSPDGQRLLLETTNGVSVVSTLNGSRLFALAGAQSDLDRNRLAVDHDWSAAAAPLPEVGAIRVWSLSDGRLISDQKVADQAISVFGLANGGRKALVVKVPWWNGSIALVDLESGTRTQLMEGTIPFAAFDESSERVTVFETSVLPRNGLWRVSDAAFLGKAAGASPWWQPPNTYCLSADFSLVGFGDWVNLDTWHWPFVAYFLQEGVVQQFPYFHFGGHYESSLSRVAFSGDNQVFGILHDDGALHLWSVFNKADPSTPLMMAQLAIGTSVRTVMVSQLLSARFSSNGNGILTLRRDNDDWKGEPRSTFGTRDAVSGRVLTRAGQAFPEDYWATDGGFSADERVFWGVCERADFVGQPLSQFRLWVQTPQQTFSRTLSKTTIGALTSDGTRFAWGETNRVFWVHLDGTNPEPQPVSLTEAGFVAKALCFSTDGSLLAAGGPAGHLAVWNVTSGTVQLSANVSAGELAVLKFSADGTRLLCGDSQGTMAVFDVTTRQVVNRIAASTHSLTEMTLDRAERVLVLADADNEVTQWSFPDGRRLAGERFFGSPITAVDISPDGGRLLVAQLRTELTVLKLPPVILRAEWVDGELELEWAGGTAPFKLQRRGQVDAGEWHEVGAAPAGRTMRIPAEEAAGFVRVLGAD